MIGLPEMLLIIGLLALVGVAAWLVFRDGRRDSEVDDWARRHGLELTPSSRPWIDEYLMVGRNLRQVGGLGGLILAMSVTAATGLDLRVSGLVWVLLGYLVGSLWAELALTRLPLGTRRAASLLTRRLGDYLPTRMRVTQVVAPVLAVALGALATVAYRWHRDWELSRLTSDGSGLVVSSPHLTDELLHSGARIAAVMAPAIMLVVWLAQRYLIGRPQPMVEPSLVAADDALRSSSTHLLGASGLAAVWLLIGGQFGYLLSTSVDRSDPWAALFGIGGIASFAAAYVSFRWRNSPWQVRHAPLADPGSAGTWSGHPPSGWPSRGATDETTDGAMSVRAAGAQDAGPFGTVGVVAMAAADAGAAAPAGAGTDHGAPATTAPAPHLTSDPAWSVRRSPLPLAIGLIVVVALSGWGLRTWGVINPSVSIYDHGLATDGQGVATASLQVHNDARSPVQIVSLVTVPSSTTVGAVIPRPPMIESVTASDLRMQHPEEVTVPFEVAGESWLQLELTLSADAVSCPTGAIQSIPFDVEITYRTAWGRRVRESIPIQSVGMIDCTPPLPTGTPPVDDVAAEAAVRSSATIAYDPAAGAARLDVIDDPRGLVEADAAARAGPYAEQVATTTATIGAVSFDRPDHAWFHYVLSVGFGTRTGEAVFVDGQWKVTRSTVCADLQLAGVTCPPLPR